MFHRLRSQHITSNVINQLYGGKYRGVLFPALRFRLNFSRFCCQIESTNFSLKNDDHTHVCSETHPNALQKSQYSSRTFRWGEDSADHAELLRAAKLGLEHRIVEANDLREGRTAEIEFATDIGRYPHYSVIRPR